MIFNEQNPYYTSGGSAMDREYMANQDPEHLNNANFEGIGPPLEGPIGAEQISEPMLTTGQIGQTIAEGHGQGSFLDTMQAAIRKGAGSLELSAGPEGSGPDTGLSLYTKQKREQIKEIAHANDVRITSVHVSPNTVGNLSGLGQRGFSDEQRFSQLQEVKKAIHFAGDTTDGSAVVVHTGEYQRPLATIPGEVDPETGEPLFKGYEEETEKMIGYLVDDRTGNIISDVKKTQFVYEPVFKTAKNFPGLVGKDDATGHRLQPDDWVDIHGNWINSEDTDRLFERVPEWDAERTRFKTVRREWDHYKQKADEWNGKHQDLIAKDPNQTRTWQEEFIRGQYENRILQMRGTSLFYGQHYEISKNQRDQYLDALKFYEKLEKEIPKDELWKIMRQDRRLMTEFGDVPYEPPTEILHRRIKETTDSMRHVHESSAAADAQADQLKEDLAHIQDISKYGKQQSIKSFADAAIYAYDVTKDRNLKKPIFVAPENIFPEFGYGSHPDELIELVQQSREEMARRLVHERGMHYGEAKKIAEKHIAATLDTEHLGLWKKNFVRKPGEMEEKFDERFNAWYLDNVKKLADSGIIGHMHIADGFGYGHGNLPAGTGNLPIKTAVKYLMEKGYTGAYLSEGYGDAQRMLRQTWEYFGSPIYAHTGPLRAGSPVRWSDVQFSYFGQTGPPNYIFGAYAPSNDWQLWSQTPME